MKKAPIAVALVLVFGLFAAALSLAPAIAQNITAPGNETAPAGNVTAPGNETAPAGAETFSASGSIATLIFDTGVTTTISEVQNDTGLAPGNETGIMGNETTPGNMTSPGNDTTMIMPQIITDGDNATDGAGNETGGILTAPGDNVTAPGNETAPAEELESPYILAGDWNLDVQDGNVSEFAATFTMVHTDGTERHTHDLSNFVSSNSTTIDISGNGTSFIFGTVDVATDGEPKWTGVDALITIENNNVITLSLATEDTEDHFGGQPIYGIVDSLTDENGNELIEGGTAPAGNATGGAAGGNQTGGGFLGNLTEGVQNLFNSTGQ